MALPAITLLQSANGRVLIHFSIIHMQADLGEAGRTVQQITIRKLGLAGWQQNLRKIDRLWNMIEQDVAGLKVEWKKVRLYQDGLPVCGHELQIVNDLAAEGSRNYALLQRLAGKGATIMGTESPDLLVKEYQLSRELLSSGDPKELAKLESHQQALRDSLLEQRDRFIAERINHTLQRGEMGLLFLGMLHSVRDFLEPDIRVHCPVYRIGSAAQ
ncbi:MAG: hypothetical protein LAP21_00210 [Acidobacteriia bacterium]|nr:hypothetical protein [Terriglobia bacterium]